MVVSNVSGVALMTSSLFLLVVAVALNSPHLFYMSTAMIVTVLAARLQAYLAVRDLTITRDAPPETRAGEWVAIELRAKASRRMRRPLVSIYDHLPPKLANGTITASTPVAPSSDEPVSSIYRFKPNRRGVYRWSKASVVGSDALGLISMALEYSANLTEMVVLPASISVPFEPTSAAGWGSATAEHGLSRGAGIDPRGTREYVYGDSMRYVHWRSTARTGRLVVKEFETGSNAALAFYLQTATGSDVGAQGRSSMELICGHLAYISARAVRQGVRIQFPTVEDGVGAVAPTEREREALRALATIDAQPSPNFATDVAQSRRRIVTGATVMFSLSIADPTLPEVILDLRRSGHAVVCHCYDAPAFLPPKAKFKGQSACANAYVDDLRSSGAVVRIMPLDGLEQMQ